MDNPETQATLDMRHRKWQIKNKHHTEN